MTKSNPLRGLIIGVWGNYNRLAAELNVSTSTVSEWVNSNPRNVLKYLPELLRISDLSADQVIEAVIEQEAKDAEAV